MGVACRPYFMPDVVGDYHAPTPAAKIVKTPPARQREPNESSRSGANYRFAKMGWLYKETLRKEEHKYAAYIQRRKLHKRQHYYHMHGQDADGSTAAEKGERRYRLFVYLVFSGLKYRLRKFQIEFTNLIIQSMAEKVIGAEAWKIIGQRIMREFGWTKVPPKIVAGAAPRRFGKTVVVATIQCAFALLMGGQEQSTFSTGARASGSIRNYVRTFLIDSGFAENLLTKGANNETLKVKTIYKGEQPSILNFFPANGLICLSSRPLPPSPIICLHHCHVSSLHVYCSVLISLAPICQF